MNSKIYASVATPSGMAGLRDLSAADVETIVAYWHNGVADLDFLGIDLARLGDPENTRARFMRALPSEDPEQRNMGYAITLDGTMIGYTLLNQYTPETNYSHWHIVDAAKRAVGVSSALYPHRIAMYFSTTIMDRLIHQTRTRNVGVNRMLDKFVPIAETRQIEQPDGVALPGEFHIRYVARGDVDAIFARAAARQELR